MTTFEQALSTTAWTELLNGGTNSHDVEGNLTW